MDVLIPIDDDYNLYQCNDKLIIESEFVPFGKNRNTTNDYTSCPKFTSSGKSIDIYRINTSDKLSLSITNNLKSNFKYPHMAILGSILYNFDIIDSVFCDIRFVSVSDIDNGWVSYIQNLYPSTWGYGMVDRSRGDDYRYDTIATKNDKFMPFYGSDASGNYNANYKQFTDYILDDGGDTINLVMIDSDLSNNTKSAYVGLKVMANKGSMIIRLKDTSKELLYILSYVFEWITLYRPLLSGNIYLVCCKYTSNPIVTSIIEKSISDNGVENNNKVDDSDNKINNSNNKINNINNIKIDDRFDLWLDFITTKLQMLSTDTKIDVRYIEGLLNLT